MNELSQQHLQPWRHKNQPNVSGCARAGEVGWKAGWKILRAASALFVLSRHQASAHRMPQVAKHRVRAYWLGYAEAGRKREPAAKRARARRMGTKW